MGGFMKILSNNISLLIAAFALSTLHSAAIAALPSAGDTISAEEAAQHMLIRLSRFQKRLRSRLVMLKYQRPMLRFRLKKTIIFLMLMMRGVFWLMHGAILRKV
jgi:hypothetical protein